jgi:predicted nucleic acid-binding protein
LIHDTWGWLALGDPKDSQHEKVKSFYKAIRLHKSQIYTSDYILDELITLIFRRTHYQQASSFVKGILLSEKAGILIVEQMTRSYFEEAWKLRVKLQDKPLISFTDLTSMIIMQKFNISQILTDDDHFAHVGMGFIKMP